MEPKIVIGVNFAEFKDSRKKKRQEVALRVLEKNKPKNVLVLLLNLETDIVLGSPSSFHIYKGLKRNSRREIGNNRDLPYVKEMLNNCSKMKCDIFGIINSDILLSKNFFDILRKEKDAYIFYRKDITDVSADSFNDNRFNYVFTEHVGNDGFFFNKSWWIKNNHLFHNDLILGETEWDTFFRYAIYSSECNYYQGRDLFHVYHDPKWSVKSKGAKNNIKLWKQFKRENNISV